MSAPQRLAALSALHDAYVAERDAVAAPLQGDLGNAASGTGAGIVLAPQRRRGLQRRIVRIDALPDRKPLGQAGWQIIQPRRGIDIPPGIVRPDIEEFPG